MKISKDKSKLRKRAERTVAKRAPSPDPRTEHDRLVQELEIHQVELEMQNEELRSARQVVESALERYTEVFDFAPIGYAVLDLEGTVKEINHAAASLLGIERGGLVGRRFGLFVARHSRLELDALIRDVLVHATPGRAELDLIRDTELVPVRLTAGALVRGARGVMLAFEDIAARRAREAELARTEQALRDANRRKDAFLAMLSHELRNPLTPIRTSVAVLQEAPAGSTAARDALAIIDRSSAHLTRLIDDLLDVTRISRGKIQLQREPLSFTELVRETVADHAYAFSERKLRVTSSVPPIDVWVYGDRARLVQVLSNVLSNAEKFTPTGGDVHVDVSAVGSAVTVSVRDTGIGIASDMLDYVFEPFAQAPQPLDRSLGGLGLGLAMVKSIIELHGGRAAIRSAGPGFGTEVALTLPIERVQADTPSALRKNAVGPRKVLVIEDKRDSAEALRYALTLKGHTVAVAYDGRSAVALAREFGPDVVLCDIGLPDMDGYAVARELRRHDGAQDVCLVALSGYARPEDIERAHDAGFDRHIAKPPRLEELDQVLALGGRDAPQQRQSIS